MTIAGFTGLLYNGAIDRREGKVDMTEEATLSAVLAVLTAKGDTNV